jgi:hypothetical protein
VWVQNRISAPILGSEKNLIRIEEILRLETTLKFHNLHITLAQSPNYGAKDAQAKMAGAIEN